MMSALLARCWDNPNAPPPIPSPTHKHVTECPWSHPNLWAALSYRLVVLMAVLFDLLECLTHSVGLSGLPDDICDADWMV